MVRSLLSKALPSCSIAAGALAVSLAVNVAAHAAEGGAPLLHAMFQDHAVLQRDQPIRIWGRAKPGEEVQVDFAGEKAHTRADEDGRWELQMPAQQAGGPHILTATAGGRTQRVNDVLVGDVWLCSGQSNMELPVHRALDSHSEISGAGSETIRLLTVPQAGSALPQETFPTPTRWMKLTPETVRDFSATCYYFARELQKTVDVPMGLINAAWGGSRIQAWISGDALRATGGFDSELDVLAQYATHPAIAAGRWGERWQQWWRALPMVAPGDEPWNPEYNADDGWGDAPPELGAWEHWGVPELADFNGMLWFRATVELTAQQAAQEARLSIGAADEIDVTWVNGRAVGSAYGGDARDYALPRGLLREGRNVVAVSVLDTYREGGLTGPHSVRALWLGDGSSVPFDGAWRYRIVREDASQAPRAPWQTVAGLTTLHNGMIAPLGRYGLRGALWYQGESNTFEADAYRDLLRILRSDWRARFGAELPLLVVQLAAYGDAPIKPAESGWAGLREVQREVATEEPRSALAVTIDIGDRYDLHPPNKQELGRRLARAARYVVYGEKLPPSGPVPLSARRLAGAGTSDAVVVAFGDVTNGLVAYGADGPVGFELCGPKTGSCHYADAEIQGNEVILRAPVAQPTRVRYGWADSPVVTLFDGARMPAGPFEIHIQ
jgi:sialate O-acetylesterase